MKKVILKTTMLAAIASLTMSGYALAHHPLLDFNTELYDRIDAILNETNSLHNEIMDARLEDDDMMTSTSRSMDGGTTQTQVNNGAANSNMTVSQGSTGAQTTAGTGAGIGINNRNR